ncbi:MAG: hypothetical protein ABIN37_04125 [Burkholderiaceae bacterium]
MQDPKFFSILLRIDIELAAQRRAQGCPCGGVLHKANYSRKPRACPLEVRADFESRFSFCCNRCRKRWTAMSVRFLGRRVYLSLAVVLMSSRPAVITPTQMALSKTLAIPIRTLNRWRVWWTEIFPTSKLWQSDCARFMPPIPAHEFPAGLIERFTGSAADSMMRLLTFLLPLSVRR